MVKAVVPPDRPTCPEKNCTYVQHVGKHSFENINVHHRKDGSVRIVVQEPKLANKFRVPRGLRKQVIKRDGPVCRYCGALLIYKHSLITVDHVIPRSLDGENTFDNLVVSCAACNHAKGNRSLEDAGMTLFPLGFFADSLAKAEMFLNRDKNQEKFVGPNQIKEYPLK